ncbi:hypothetical protein B0T16DRAFT_405266 [Cercophora newfieldiana]|uniref:Uncharacterized protein n=1 Tax=Cercophora newfieldiana TaxID=92897 RepID=A0AA39YGN3_9PEZI|nr:hypothetical protein B0T16DRAFT_405266 [Cercophora newfieldiana]
MAFSKHNLQFPVTITTVHLTTPAQLAQQSCARGSSPPPQSTTTNFLPEPSYVAMLPGARPSSIFTALSPPPVPYRLHIDALLHTNSSHHITSSPVLASIDKPTSCC